MGFRVVHRVFGRVGALSILLMLFAVCAAASEVSYAGSITQDGKSEATRRAARARWEKLSPAERERMRERFENLKRMSPEQRERVTAQANRLNEMRRSLWKSLDVKTRKRLDKLGTQKRLQLLDEMLADEVEGTAQRIIARMPEKDRERLQAARPQDRLRFLMERKRHQDQESDVALRRIATELGLRPQDAEKLRDLPPQQRRQKMREVLRTRIVRNVATGGLPEGVDRKGWERIRALPVDEFFAAFARLRRSHPMFGSAVGDAASVPAGSAQAKLRHALQARPQDRMELSDLTPEERQRSMTSRRRARVMEVIRAEKLLPPERIRELESQPFPRFMRIVRGLSSRGRRGPREAPRRGGG